MIVDSAFDNYTCLYVQHVGRLIPLFRSLLKNWMSKMKHCFVVKKCLKREKKAIPDVTLKKKSRNRASFAVTMPPVAITNAGHVKAARYCQIV